jgi:hypothetical protein
MGIANGTRRSRELESAAFQGAYPWRTPALATIFCSGADLPGSAAEEEAGDCRPNCCIAAMQ